MGRRRIEFDRSVFRLDDLPTYGLPEICISGRSNVGKSSLINKIAGRKSLAKISRKPGKTRSINFYIVDDAFFLVDLPGYGYAKVPKTERELFANIVEPYLNQRQELRGIMQLVDGRHGPVSGDHAMIEWINSWDGESLYVFTKSDKLRARDKEKVKKVYTKEAQAEDYVLFSSVTGTGTQEIWQWVSTVLGVKI